jgi:arginyl-tRNA synthetase
MLHASAEDAMTEAISRLGDSVARVPLRSITLADRWGITSNVAFLIGKENARAVAERLAGELATLLAADPRFSEVRAEKGYVNILFSPAEVARLILNAVLTNPDYGQGSPRSPERILVEYSQPNTHKAFHIGHLRNAVLGSALVNILRFYGHEVLSATYPGDTGAHVFKTLWAYLRHHKGEEPPAVGASRWLGDIYAEGHREEAEAEEAALRASARMLAAAARTFSVPLVAEGIAQFLNLAEPHRGELLAITQIALKGEDAFLEAVPSHRYLVTRLLRGLHSALPESRETLLSAGLCRPEDLDGVGRYLVLDDDLRAIFARWENRDPEIVDLWQKTRAWSLADFNRIYAELGIRFDHSFYESEMEEPGKAIVRELLARGIARESDGAVVVPLDELTKGDGALGTLLILRSDGTPLYSTKDLALAKIKIDQFGIDRSIYVVSTQQSQYFRQVFATLRLWGFPQADKCVHLAYEIVTLPEGMMSSRKGNVVLYDDLAEMLRRKALETVSEKAPHLSKDEREEIAHRVADGAMKFTMIYRENARVLVFDPDESLSFEGRSAPYLQYGFARATRIVEKAGFAVSPDDLQCIQFPILHPNEIRLLKHLQEFPDVIARAASEFAPHHVAQFLFALTQAFNDFYHTCPVIQAEAPLRKPRLALVQAYRAVAAKGLSLLGIMPLERM